MINSLKYPILYEVDEKIVEIPSSGLDIRTTLAMKIIIVKNTRNHILKRINRILI